MAKADYIRRKWMKLIHNGSETNIVRFLQALGVITAQQQDQFLHDTSMAYSKWLHAQRKEDDRIASRSFSKRPPRIIKPTGVRR